MCPSKRYVLTTLVLVVAFAAVPSLDVQPRALGLTPDSRPYPPVVSRTKSDHPANAFLPAQSRNPKDVGIGKLLVASRTLGDPNFAETVVLLVRCNSDGVVGLVLNRRTDVPLSRVLEQFEAAKGRSDPVYLGGPVETPAVFALLRSTAKPDGADQIFSGVYLISTKDLFEKTIAGRPDPGKFHVYLGYAGWSSDQLRAEIELGSWFIFQGDAKTVFDSEPDSLWRQLIQKTELKSVSNEPADAPSQASRPSLYN